MTGPEHYRTAEGCLDFAENEEHFGSPAEVYYLRRAQVHAALALAAATALRGNIAGSDYDTWLSAVSASPAFKPPVNGGES